MIWAIYYVVYIIWISVLFRKYVELYDEGFNFYYGFSKTLIYIKDIKKIEKSKSFAVSSVNSLDWIYIDTMQAEALLQTQVQKYL